MLSTITRPSRALTTILAVLIVALIAGGAVAAVVNGGDHTETAAEKQAKADAAAAKASAADKARQDAAAKAAAGAEAADKKALDLITANQETCKSRYVPDAEARAKAALDQLKEQRAALEKVQAELPAGRAKDTLAAQLGPEFDSSVAVINSELLSAKTRCQLAYTIYQLTH